MMIEDLLEQELARLADRLAETDIPLIVGGGYGLVLRHRHLLRNEIRTLREILQVRSTQDLDLFLTAEVIADADKVTLLRDVLSELGYSVVQGAEYYQFSRPIEQLGSIRVVKIDLLAPVPEDPDLHDRVKVDRPGPHSRRIRPRAAREIHAHVAREALTIGEYLLTIDIRGTAVFLPHPFSYLLMKLHALRDAMKDQRYTEGNHHAFDLYQVIAMTTEAEWSEAEELLHRYGETEAVETARTIIRDIFGSQDARGTLTLLDHARTAGIDAGRLDLPGFLRDLHDLFAVE